MTDFIIKKLSYDLTSHAGLALVVQYTQRLCQVLDGADLLVFSDFNYGCLPKPLVQQLVRIAKSRGVMVAADSQSRRSWATSAASRAWA